MKFLRALRKRAGLSQMKLAEFLNVHLNTVWAWENNKNDGPNSQQLIKICELLHVTETELLNGPRDDTWELKLVFRKETELGGETMDMSGNTVSAVLVIGDGAMRIELGAPFALWKNEAKFEALIEQLRAKRMAGLKVYKESW